MYSKLIVPTFAPGARDEAMAAIARGAQTLGAASTLFAPTLPGVYNGGDAIFRATFADKAAADAAFASEGWSAARTLLADPSVTVHTDRADFPTGEHGGENPGKGVYRVALFRASVRPTPERLAAFGIQTASLAHYIKSIRRWQIGIAEEAGGLHAWTHVWEQEYRDLDGLLGPYMLHPAHWAHVERWFDPEYGEWLVDPLLVHSFCAIDEAVIIG